MGKHKVIILTSPALFNIIENPYTLSFEIEDERIADKESSLSIKAAQKLLQSRKESSDEVSIKYFVSFDNGSGQTRHAEVSEEVFADFLRTGLDNEASRYIYRRYQDLFIDSEQAEKEYSVTALSLEDQFLQRDIIRKLHDRLSCSLSNTECRRVIMYYFHDMNYSEIAKREKVSVSTVHESISNAVKKLKKALEPD